MSRAKRFAVILTVLFAATAGAQGPSRPPGSVTYLGEAQIDGSRDHSSIQVGNQQGKFRAIQLRVENNPLRLNHIIVRYGDGGFQTVQIKSLLATGESTHVLNLRHTRRGVLSVDIWYDRPDASAQQPKVTLWGLG